MIRIAMATTKKSNDDISDKGLAVVKKCVAELEALQDSGKLTKDVYKALAREAKRASGKSWSDVAESIENFKPGR